MPPVSRTSATSTTANKQRTSSVSTVSNFSRPTTSAPAVPQLPQVAQHAPLPIDLRASIIYDNGYGYTGTEQSQSESPQPAYVKKRYRPSEDFSRKPIPHSSSIQLSDVSVGIAVHQRGANVQSIAGSTHDAQSLCSSRISQVQDQDDAWWLTDADPVQIPRPLKPRSPPPISRRRVQHTHQSDVSASGTLHRSFAFPARSESVHPSSHILLSSHSPEVRARVTTQRGLLHALETATVPAIPGYNAEPPQWWQVWPEAKPLPPVSIRTQSTLRTYNVASTSNTDDHAPTSGQGTHFANIAQFRFCQRTRTHGPETDFSHPSYAGSVAAGRALWQASYRNENYSAPLRAPTQTVHPVRRSPSEGRWLQGRTLRLAQDRHNVEGQPVESKTLVKGHKRGWSTQSVQSTVKVVRRASSKLKRWASIGGSGKPTEKKEKKEKRKYTPVPIGQDVSGWYTDSSDD